MNFSLQLRRNASSNLDLEKSRNRIELDRRISKYEDNCEYKNCPLQVHILKGTKTLNVFIELRSPTNFHRFNLFFIKGQNDIVKTLFLVTSRL